MSYMDLKSLRDSGHDLSELVHVQGHSFASTCKDRSFTSTDEGSKHASTLGGAAAARRSSYALSCQSGVMQLIVQDEQHEEAQQLQQHTERQESYRHQLEIQDVEDENEKIGDALTHATSRVPDPFGKQRPPAPQTPTAVVPWTSRLVDEPPRSTPVGMRDAASTVKVRFRQESTRHSYSSFRKLGVRTPDSFRRRHPRLSADDAERLSAQQQLRVMQGGMR